MYRLYSVTTSSVYLTLILVIYSVSCVSAVYRLYSVTTSSVYLTLILVIYSVSCDSAVYRLYSVTTSSVYLTLALVTNISPVCCVGSVLCDLQLCLFDPCYSNRIFSCVSAQPVLYSMTYNCVCMTIALSIYCTVSPVSLLCWYFIVRLLLCLPDHRLVICCFSCVSDVSVLYYGISSCVSLTLH